MATSNSQRLARWFFAVVLTVVLAPAAARADRSDEAKAHVAKATQAHKERRYDDARVELEAAYALTPKPELLYALGQVNAKLGRCAEAAASYRQFAASQSDPQVPKVVEQAITACTPAAPPATAPAAPPATEPAARSEPRPWYHDKLGDGLVLGGVVLGILGILEYGAARSDLDAAENHASTTTLARYHQLVDDARGERMTAIVLIGSGSLLIAAGIAHYVLHDRGTEVRVGAAPVRGGGVVTYQGSF